MVLKIFIFLCWLFGHIKKRDKDNLKVYDVTTWKTNNCNNILSNISRSKVNQTVKFGKLIEYNMRNNFLEKSYTKFVGETIPRPLKIKMEHISGSIIWSFKQFVYIVCQVEGYRNILKLRYRAPAFTSYKAFFKNKKRSITSLSASFSAWFLKKNISLVIFY